MTRRHKMRCALASCLAILAAAAPLEALELALPVECEVGRTCFIQQYVDHDSSTGAVDHACGTAAYDGHDGTDFRLRTTRDAEQGVGVLAAAEGKVAGLRDGMPDRLARTPGEMQAIEDRECGNGVVVDHGGGWETQYCHMKRGSVAVEAGETVAAGQQLGEIGYSGAAAFPHLHLTVRRDGKAVDPFLGEGGGSCGGAAEPLWNAAARAVLGYRPGELLDMGFAEGPVELEAVETGAVPEEEFDRRSPAIVAWGWAINLRKDDEVVVTLAGPDGRELARNALALDRNKAHYMLFAGKKRPSAGWPAGRYVGRFTVTREGATAIEGERELVVE